MAVATSRTQANLAVGDTRGGKRVAGIFDAAAGKYAWIDDLESSAASAAITVDPAPAIEGDYVAEYAAAGVFTLPALATLNEGERITFINNNGTAMTVTPAAGEALNGAVDGSFLSESAGQEVTIRKTANGWRVGPNVVSAMSTTRLGDIIHTTPDTAKGKYLLDGSTYSDAVLAAHLTANPVTGFTVTGGTVTTPDWSGRYLGSSGALGIGAAGQTLTSTNKSHSHTIGSNGSHAHNQPLGGAQGGANAYGAGNINVTSTNTTNTAGAHSHSLTAEGGIYGRPETASMPLCIIGTEQANIQAGTLIPEPLAPVIGVADGNGNPTGSTFTPTNTGLYELNATGTIYHNIAVGSATCTVQVREGSTVIAERFAQQGANQDNGVRQTVSYHIADIPLVAGTTYNINLLLGGSSFTDGGDFWYIALKQQPTSTAVRAEDAALVLYTGTAPAGATHTESIPLAVNGKTLVDVSGKMSYGGNNYVMAQDNVSDIVRIAFDPVAGNVSFLNRVGAYANAQAFRILATYM